MKIEIIFKDDAKGQFTNVYYVSVIEELHCLKILFNNGNLSIFNLENVKYWSVCNG